MSISALSSSSLLYSYQTQAASQNQAQTIVGEFEQVGQDLQAGNLSQAQSDFSALTQSLSGAPQGSQGPLAQELSTLGQTLQSGDLTGAQQAYSSIQQTVQAHPHHHHHHGGSGEQTGAASGAANDVLSQLGQALQSGDLSSAQQSFSSLLQLFNSSSNVYGSSGSVSPVSTPGVTLNTTA